MKMAGKKLILGLVSTSLLIVGLHSSTTWAQPTSSLPEDPVAWSRPELTEEENILNFRCHEIGFKRGLIAGYDQTQLDPSLISSIACQHPLLNEYFQMGWRNGEAQGLREFRHDQIAVAPLRASNRMTPSLSLWGSGENSDSSSSGRPPKRAD